MKRLLGSVIVFLALLPVLPAEALKEINVDFDSGKTTESVITSPVAEQEEFFSTDRNLEAENSRLREVIRRQRDILRRQQQVIEGQKEEIRRQRDINRGLELLCRAGRSTFPKAGKPSGGSVRP